MKRKKEKKGEKKKKEEEDMWGEREDDGRKMKTKEINFNIFFVVLIYLMVVYFDKD